ncbi:hypothetical protein H310_08480 [Aphanomyces invadans]|uniref:DUF4209 domain-containing protein n=1 Tax=Aphanomyces invadans TaxID=157072 RepID=A0A024U089_9STRA|nr:hypothetical protein H310_08480 [Aphanomyces invadans]ETV99007.1 hypothetical protein H310_08480 [Aphanomyces invadans]|eukprot:XP_008872435.1 hypothetical protein H310_08480 [Aphanomyces invadans]
MDDELSTGVSFRGIDCVWTLAHAVHAAMEHDSVEVTIHSSLTHASVVPFVVDQLRHGHFYASFTILVTILERALYDQYAALHKGQKSNMILRDLLHSPTLHKHLPRGYMQVLHVLFLPSGLNIRNLVWHGFLAPFELPGCLNSLLLVLLADPCLQRDGCRRVAEQRTQHLPSMHPARVQWTWATFSDIALPASPTKDMCPSYAMVVKSRWGLLHEAMAAFASGRSLWSLFLAIPVLEHLVRCEFVVQNAPAVPTAMQFAQLKQYYSTLDGFGQRHQHQVLLARELFLPNADKDEMHNRLYESLPHSVLAACLDLFMAAAGPNIRAKLCHGELSLDTLHASPGYTSPDMTSLDVCAGLVLAVLVEILVPGSLLYTGSPLDSYECRFHPYNMVLQSLEQFEATLTTWIDMQPAFSYTASPSPAHADQAIWEWTAMNPASISAAATIQFTDKRSRMLSTATLAWDGSTTQFDSIPDAVATLLALLEKLSVSLATNHGSASRYLNHRSRDIQPSTTRSLELPRLNLITFHALPASACMLAVLDACQRLLNHSMARLRALRDVVVQGTARTSHRRSLVNQVLMAPCLSHIARLTGAIVEHQVGMAHDAGCIEGRVFDGVAEKLLQFIVALDDDKKSVDKQVHMALQFWNSKAIRGPICSSPWS